MSANAPDLSTAFADAAEHRLTADLELITHCLDQLIDDQVWWRPQPSMNSIGNLLLHVVGNLRQWIVSGVGGAEDDRDRPREFSERGPIGKGELLSALAAAIGDATNAIRNADADELMATRRIQGFEASGLAAAFESVAHLQGHTQEIICMTRLQLGDNYQFHWQPSTAEEGAGE